jgi:hypothetical protein
MTIWEQKRGLGAGLVPISAWTMPYSSGSDEEGGSSPAPTFNSPNAPWTPVEGCSPRWWPGRVQVRDTLHPAL